MHLASPWVPSDDALANWRPLVSGAVWFFTPRILQAIVQAPTNGVALKPTCMALRAEWLWRKLHTFDLHSPSWNVCQDSTRYEVVELLPWNAPRPPAVRLQC